MTQPRKRRERGSTSSHLQKEKKCRKTEGKERAGRGGGLLIGKKKKKKKTASGQTDAGGGGFEVRFCPDRMEGEMGGSRHRRFLTFSQSPKKIWERGEEKSAAVDFASEDWGGRGREL